MRFILREFVEAAFERDTQLSSLQLTVDDNSLVGSCGTDLTDATVPFGTKDESLADVEVVLTNQISELTGTVADARGQPAADYVAVVFAVDRSRRYQGSRFVRLSRPAEDGVFSIPALPADEYYVAALEWVQGDDWQDPAFLESLAARATRISLAEKQKRAVSLTLIVR